MLTSRIRLIPIASPAEPRREEQEDILSSSLDVIFTDDITNQHGDAQNSVVYASPSVGDVHLTLADPEGEGSRRLFSHFLWNAGLELALLMEEGARAGTRAGDADWGVRGQKVLELGAGTGLAGIMAAYMGAGEVVISDYPAPEVLANIQSNVTRNVDARRRRTKKDASNIAATGGREAGAVGVAGTSQQPELEINAVTVAGHEWGVLTDPFSMANAHSFTRLLVADCLWMPHQHHNLLVSISHFLSPSPDARAWVIAGFHTGREKMRGFFGDELLKQDDVNLKVEQIWERNAEGEERDWVWDRGIEDVTGRKRWLVIAVLQRREAA